MSTLRKGPDYQIGPFYFLLKNTPSSQLLAIVLEQ